MLVSEQQRYSDIETVVTLDRRDVLTKTTFNVQDTAKVFPAPVLAPDSIESTNGSKERSEDQCHPLTSSQALVKRAFDLSAGAIALLLFLPLLLIVALLIKLDSKGSALYRQTRMGLNGRQFEVYKFRTMRTEGDKRFVQASKDDPRVTRVGKFLRRTSIDELPQLFNVLDGSMSLVGPRPHPLALDTQFSRIVPSFETRYLVKPGITGLAQIKGYRGETRTLDSMVNRVKFDLVYIARWNIMLDIKLLLATVFKGWVHKNAY